MVVQNPRRCLWRLHPPLFTSYKLQDNTPPPKINSRHVLHLDVNVNVKEYALQQKFSEVSIGLCEEMGFQPGPKLSKTDGWWAKMWWKRVPDGWAATWKLRRRDNHVTAWMVLGDRLFSGDHAPLSPASLQFAPPLHSRALETETRPAAVTHCVM